MSVILGVNHQFLYPESIVNEEAHTSTLRALSQSAHIQALDCWVWRGRQRAAEEASILRSCGKVINYNAGNRFGEERVFPTAADEKQRTRAYDHYMREISLALDVGAKKIVMASGPDTPHGREAAKERLYEFLLKLMSQLPAGVSLSLEATDRDMDKRYLFGPLAETVAFIKKLHADGLHQIGLLLDMGHIPLLHETLASAINASRSVLNHIHLGNAVVKNKSDPLYGDKHVPWGYPGSEYTEQDGASFVRMLREIGYTDGENATVSFEMRPYAGLSADESLRRFVAVFESGMTVEQ